MLDQEMKNLENLKAFTNSANNRQDRARAEANIRQMLEKIRQVGGEVINDIFNSNFYFNIANRTYK